MSDFNLARLKKGSNVFEIVIDPEKAVLAKKNLDLVEEALVHPKIYSDAKKGNLASEQILLEIFKTSDPIEIAKRIIKEGVVQVTSEHRKEIVEQKKNRIVNYIHRNSIDPRTNAPHPVSRIVSAFDQAKVKIDEYKSSEQQVQDIIKLLRPILPIKFVVKEVDVVIDPVNAGKSYVQIKNFGKTIREEWLNDGSWHAVIEIPGGLEGDFFDLINKLTKGYAQAKIINTRG
jgi:ribosome maturation protein SDO1